MKRFLSRLRKWLTHTSLTKKHRKNSSILTVEEKQRFASTNGEGKFREEMDTIREGLVDTVQDRHKD